MKQSLQLRISQNLTMTPQLQQAIKLLQLPTIELQNEIQQVLESNPMLETAEDSQIENYSSTESENTHEPSVNEPSTTAESENNSPDEIASDDSWEEPWNSNFTNSNKSSGEYNERDFFENQSDSYTSLHDHLMWQLNLTPLNDTDRAIATTLIDAITEDGYLNEDLENIHQSFPAEMEIELDEIQAVMHLVQHFDPIGVGARTPKECLLLQLNTFSEKTEGLELAKDIVNNYLELLASRDYTKLKRLTKAEDSALQAAELLIQSLNPKPGTTVTTSHTEYVVPDVFVTKRNSAWRVELNPDLAPRIHINAMYANMVRRADKSEDNNYLKTNLQEARWFLKSLQSRNETILKVATKIVEKQRAFFEYGDEAMKPLVLRDIAEILDMHESTISRVTNQKYMHTPRGIYEFKHFFSSHVSTADGGECSATAIRAMIKKLVAGEDASKPLSDSKISNLLDKQGIHVARRTVAKYRESMSIPPSNERKRLT